MPGGWGSFSDGGTDFQQVRPEDRSCRIRNAPFAERRRQYFPAFKCQREFGGKILSLGIPASFLTSEYPRLKRGEERRKRQQVILMRGMRVAGENNGWGWKVARSQWRGLSRWRGQHASWENPACTAAMVSASCFAEVKRCRGGAWVRPAARSRGPAKGKKQRFANKMSD
jgi:hypothetical protein